MNKISMDMPREEMFTIIQTLKKVNKTLRLKHIGEAIKLAREAIPDNETEHMVFVLLNDYGLHIGTHVYHSTSSKKCVLDVTKILRKILGTPGVGSVAVAHNHPFTSELKPSRTDIKWSLQMAVVFMMTGIDVVDFFILNHIDCYSFREHRPKLFDNASKKIKKLLSIK
jgi:DNA repair protein RadC